MLFSRVFRIDLLLVMAASAGCSGKPVASVIVSEPAVDVEPLLQSVSKSKANPSFKDFNIVLVSFDALQAGHVGCLGNARNVTPTLDAVARHGYCFTRATSVASWTVPASMTWFTGVYPSEHGMTNKYAVYDAKTQKLARLDEMSPHLATLADVLKQNGYATGGFTGNAGVSGGFGYDQGFDIYFFKPDQFGSMDQSIPEALAWAKTNRGRKFFLFLHGYDIHGQNTPAAGFDYRFVDPGYDKRFTGSEQEQEALREEGLDKGQLTLRDADVQFWRAVYDEKIQRADAKFSRFLRNYAALGLLAKTIFILTSDHGTELYEHRRFDHGFTLYQEQIHVPLIVWAPGMGRGLRIEDRVSSIDVMPTVLDLLEIQKSPGLQKQLRGKSLLPAMRGEPSQRPVYSETNYRQFTYKRSIIAPSDWKLIYTLESKERELYQLRDDPGELRNQAAAEPAVADALERQLFEYFKSIGHDLTAHPWKTGHNPVYNLPGKRSSNK